MVDFIVNFIGAWTFKNFDICLFTLIIAPILSIPRIGGSKDSASSFPPHAKAGEKDVVGTRGHGHYIEY